MKEITVETQRARLYALHLQAEEILDALRDARDLAPKEWDALIATPGGERLVQLWDYLKEEEKKYREGTIDIKPIPLK